MSKLLQLRVDEQLKLAADQVFSDMGIDTSTAIRIFLTKAIQTRSLPFQVSSDKKFIELNDGYGSYIGEDGALHDFSKLKLDEPQEIVGPFSTAREAIDHLNAD